MYNFVLISKLSMENVFAKRLKELREKKNLSLQQLADMVGVAKQSIHKFENGLVNPSSESTLKLADALNVSYSFFYDSPASYSFENIRFRDGHKISERSEMERAIKQEVLEYVTRFIELQDLMGIDQLFENPLTDLKILEERDIEKAAKLIRKKWKIGNGPIADVIETLETKGVLVVEVNRPESFLGLSGMFNDNYPVIVLNAGFPTIERKRFTALHELGHLVLEFEQGFSDDKIEAFCNYFAGAVLLVDEMLHSTLGKNRTSISLAELRRIKESYGISIQAIIVRARSAGFINYETYINWKQTYSEWQHESQENRDFGRFDCKENATQYKNLLVQGITERRISWSKAAELTGKKIDVLRREFNDPKFSMLN